MFISTKVCGRSIKGDKITSECPLTRRSQRIGGPIQPGGGGRRISTGDNHGECDVLGVVAVPGKVEGRRRGARLGACMCRLKCGSNLVILHDIWKCFPWPNIFGEFSFTNLFYVTSLFLSSWSWGSKLLGQGTMHECPNCQYLSCIIMLINLTEL